MANAPQYSQQPIIVYQQGTFSRFLGWLGWAAFFLCALILMTQWSTMAEYFDTSGGITEKFVSGDKFGDDKIAIISIEGVIAEGDGFVKRQIDRVAKDENVKAIVVRVDSPGGTVTGSDYILHHLKKLRKEKSDIPLVVSMGSMAASGGYYVSMAVGDQENVIYAEPTTTTGSIGVIIPHYDISGLMAKFDIKDDSIASHERKQMLTMTKPIPQEHREIIQGYVNESFGRFKSIIKEGRPGFKADESKLDQLATGEIFSADQALKHGLVDKIGFIEDAIDRALELAKLDKAKTRVVEFEKPASLFDVGAIAMSHAAEPAGRSELHLLMEMSTPRPYYLLTSLPILAGSHRGRE